MARIVKEEEYAARRNEILDVAQRLVYTKGYEQMSIQDILNELEISKGAFYHYFDSKQALLVALIDHTIEEALKVITPIVEDSELPTLEKTNRFFSTASRWKTERKEYLLAIMRAWYTDDNAILRQKLTVGMIQHIAPALTSIIQQGVREGVFSTPYPDQASEALISLLLGFGENFARLLFTDTPECIDHNRIEKTTLAYTDALERILGAPSGSLQIVDMETLKEWFQ